MRWPSICILGFVLALLPGLGQAQQNKNNNFVFARVPGGAGGNGLPAVWVAGAASGLNSPATQMLSQIRAHNRMVTAYGAMTRDLEQARFIRASAVQQEIANSVAYVRAYYDKKAIYEAEKAKRYVSPLDAQKLRESKTWEWLKDHPEMTVNSIIDGRAQNFLLHRLAGSMLALKFSGGNDEPDPEMVKQLRLPPVLLHSVRLQQELPGGQRFVFCADEGVALKSDWWPFALRGDELAAPRAAFEKARRAAVIESQAGAISNKCLVDLMKSLDAIDVEFQKRFDRSARLKTSGNFQHYLTAQRFIQSLAGEISRLQATGDAKAFDGSLKFTGDDLFALMTYMTRNGLEFAPAQPGEEAAYQHVFKLMRDLYVVIAE